MKRRKKTHYYNTFWNLIQYNYILKISSVYKIKIEILLLEYIWIY